MMSHQNNYLPYRQLREFRNGYVELLGSLNPNFMITFNFGYRVAVMDAYNRMKGFCAKLDRKALGRNWCKRAGADRLRLIAFGERLTLNPHWHAAAYVPEKTVRALRHYGKEIWKEYAQRGQLDFAPIDNEFSVRRYITKEIAKAQFEKNAKEAFDAVFVYGPNPATTGYRREGHENG